MFNQKEISTNIFWVDDVKMLWRLCATELAIMDDADWCRLMTDKHREILEFENDIEASGYFYVSGHYFRLTCNQCTDHL